MVKTFSPQGMTFIILSACYSVSLLLFHLSTFTCLKRELKKTLWKNISYKNVTKLFNFCVFGPLTSDYVPFLITLRYF